MLIDPYVYPGTDVLINKFDCKDQARLNEMEADFTVLKLASLSVNPLTGAYDITHLQLMHRCIFEDVFDWAGKFRTIDIEKSELALAGLSVEYSKHNAIESGLSAAINEMHDIDWAALNQNEKAQAFSKTLAHVWQVHPFREGNTRTITHFCCQFYDSKNEPINRKLFEENVAYLRSSLVAACAIFTDLGDHSDYSYLLRIVSDAINTIKMK